MKGFYPISNITSECPVFPSTVQPSTENEKPTTKPTTTTKQTKQKPLKILASYCLTQNTNCIKEMTTPFNFTLTILNYTQYLE